ncbi:amino acid permease [Ostertagia ostertagi]
MSSSDPDIPGGNVGAKSQSKESPSPQSGDRGDLSPSVASKVRAFEVDDKAAEERQDEKTIDGDTALEEEEGDEALARTLTLTNCVSMVVGGVIGSGIFVSPTGVQQSAGSVGASIIIWILCGFWCGLGAYIYAELGVLITRSGADYAYIMEAPVAVTVKSLTFALYIIRPFYPDCDPPDGVVELLAIVMIMSLSGINCYSVNAVRKLQDWFTVTKVLALLMVIVTGDFLLIFGGSQYWDSFDHLFEGNFRTFGSAAIAFYSGAFAYQGWAYLNTVTEEIIDPKRTLPLAIMISMIIITFVYVFYNIALYVVLSPDELILHAAASEVFAHKVYGNFSFIMSLFVAISTFGSANGTIMMSSSVIIGFQGFISILYIFLSSNVFVLINAAQTTCWVAYTLAALALLVLRYKMPDADRPVKVQLLYVCHKQSRYM